MSRTKTIAFTLLIIALATLAQASLGQYNINIIDIDEDELEQCADAVDHEQDQTADADEEIGCTYPLWNAQIEGNTWNTMGEDQTQGERTSAFFPSITLRGNETKIREEGSPHTNIQNTNNEYLGQRFEDNSQNELTGIIDETSITQVITSLNEPLQQGEEQHYASSNLTQYQNSIELDREHAYIQEIQFTDDVDQPTTSHTRTGTYDPMQTETIERPLRRPMAREEKQDNVNTITTYQVVNAPHNIEGNPDNTESNAGNGYIDSSNINQETENTALGNEAGNYEDHYNITNEEHDNWLADYGRIFEKHALDDEHVDVPLGTDGGAFRCLDDRGDSARDTSSACTNCCTVSCTPYEEDDSSCSTGGNDADVTCEDSDSVRNSEDNTYYEVRGGNEIHRVDCNSEPGSAASCNYQTGKASDGSCYNSSTLTSTSGDLRDWEDTDYMNCNALTTIDGASDFIGNNPSTTSTWFTAYEDPNWTPYDFDGSDESDHDGGSAWCGWDPEKTITINADGPNGKGNGWVVVDESESGEDRIISRQDSQGGNSVGQNVHYRRGTHIDDGEAPDKGLQKSDNDFIMQAFDGEPECPGSKSICALYLNYRTQEDLWVWAGDTETTIENSLKIDRVHNITANESYGACKLINRIYRSDNPDNNRNAELITCDYKSTKGAEDDSSRDHISGPDGLGEQGVSASPLPQACGDEPGEHIFAMSGPEINHDRMVGIGYSHGYLNHHQRCVDIDQDTTVNELRGSQQVTENSCLNKGEVYREGTVKPARRHRPDFHYDPFDVEGDPDEWEIERDYDEDAQSPRNLDHGGDPAIGPPVYETDGDQLQESPDWEVCLNIDAARNEFGQGDDSTGLDRGSGTEDIGGQWYDLDDERVTEYLKMSENEHLITDGNRFNRNDIAYYWRKNHNPVHNYWNPRGESIGVSLEPNCGNSEHPRIDSSAQCGETETNDDISYEVPIFYNFLREAAGFNTQEFQQEMN